MSWLGDNPDEAAAAWDARLRGARTTDADHKAFQAWLQQDSEHQRAYDRLQSALRTLRAHADLPELSALRDEARNTVHASRRRRMAGALALAAGIAAIVTVGALPKQEAGLAVVAEQVDEQIYATRPHEWTRVTLADGSLVTLDGNTRMAVRLDEHRRDIRLVGGRALFKVAKDQGRPFVVKAGNRTITALGTLFDVRVTPRELRVTLAEGSVAVRPAAGGPRLPQQILKPSQQLVAVAGSATPLLRSVDIQNALAWAERQFFFEDEPLATAVEEINRNADLQIIVDPSVADLRINGMFRVSDETAFIEALKLTLPIEVRPDRQGRLIITRAGARVAAM